MDLIGSFENIMSDMTPEELERANSEPSPRRARELALQQEQQEAEAVEDVFSRPPQSAAVAPPPIDERARRLAARLVGAGAGAQSGAWTILIGEQLAARLDGRTPGPVLIGRGTRGDAVADANHLLVDLAVASRHHCQISAQGDVAVVVDLGSKNGTYVNRGGNIIAVGTQPVPLQDGDAIATAAGAAVLATVGRVTP